MQIWWVSFKCNLELELICFRQRERERLWACLSSHSHSACEFSLSPRSHYFDLILCPCFGWDSPTYSAPNWTTCLASGAGYAEVKSSFCFIYLLKSHSCLRMFFISLFPRVLSDSFCLDCRRFLKEIFCPYKAVDVLLASSDLIVLTWSTKSVFVRPYI